MWIIICAFVAIAAISNLFYVYGDSNINTLDRSTGERKMNGAVVYVIVSLLLLMGSGISTM